jgi:signal transduction histidine kinase
MKSFIQTFLFLLIGIHTCLCQDSAVLLSAKMFDNYQVTPLSPSNGWLFKQGNDPSWAKKDINTADWKKLNPMGLSAKYADKTGRVEGWFRLKFKLDNDFNNIPLAFGRGGWAATDIYLDENWVASFGSTGINGKKFAEYNPIDKLSMPVKVEPGKEHLMAMHIVDYLSPLLSYQLKSAINGGVRPETTDGLKYFIMLTGPESNARTQSTLRLTLFYRSIWISALSLLALLFWLLFFLNPGERHILLPIALFSSFSALTNLPRFFLTDPTISFFAWWANVLFQRLCYWIALVMAFIIITSIFNLKLSRSFKHVLTVYSFTGFILAFSNYWDFFFGANGVIWLLVIIYIFVSSRKKLRGAQWAIAGGLALTTLFWVAYTFLPPHLRSLSINLLLLTCMYFSAPLSLAVYVSLRFREIISEVRQNAKQVVQLSEEKRKQALNQQEILQEEVNRQTAELRHTLENLKSTQAQLIQSEKMASLGELTAGIAHEIQNPLNFMNNFSDVNTELIDELNQEAAKGNIEEVKAIAKNIKDNEEKINHHGRRADAIVKGMLQHSRVSTGQKELTDINALCDEYMRLAYHGFRAKDKAFNVKYETDFDNTIGIINIVPQEIGRVILNLINNAFYAVYERQRQSLSGYEPSIALITTRQNGKIEIKVKDNGDGIPQKVLDKIFQPFFTTKPTGQGTGLGLSLAYDIIKAHGGEINVETKEGEGSKFIVSIPFTQ